MSMFSNHLHNNESVRFSHFRIFGFSVFFQFNLDLLFEKEKYVWLYDFSLLIVSDVLSCLFTVTLRFQTAPVSGRVTPSPRTSITESSSDASLQESRRWSWLRSPWSWPWPLGRRGPAPCCSAPRTPTLSSSCRWSRRSVSIMCWPSSSLCCTYETMMMTIILCVCPPGGDCVSGRHAAGIPCHWQPAAHDQVLLHTYFSPVWGRHYHRT